MQTLQNCVCVSLSRHFRITTRGGRSHICACEFVFSVFGQTKELRTLHVFKNIQGHNGNANKNIQNFFVSVELFKYVIVFVAHDDMMFL